MASTMKIAPWHIAVLIPARNEEDLLPRCLLSVLKARLCLPKRVTCKIVVVSDCSNDGTFEIAQQILKDFGSVLRSETGLAGAARALAASAALERYSGAHDRCWLANTDADCEVPANWLLDQLAIAARGYVAVAGTVDVDSFVEHEAYVRERFRLTYRVHPDGTHPHVHGANLGVRADAYLRAGGWADLATGEDHDLWQRLQSDEHLSISDAALQVTTSGRRHGRAPKGFADALAAHNEAAA